jgi:hypothetical protein
MSATVIQFKPEITGPDAPQTATGKPPAEKPEGTIQAPAPANTETPQRPEWCPEKFWKDGKVDSEGLAKSYGELEKKSSAPKPETTPEVEQTAEQKPEGQQPETPKGQEAFKPFFEEFEKTGKLSDESYAALEKQGFSRKMVDAYARGVQAERSEAEGKVFDAVGGKDEYAKVTEWAGKNLSPAEINAFNSMLETGTVEQIALAAAGLKTRYEAANGKPSRLVHGSPHGGGVAPFRSSAEVTAAMSDPRYREDQAYRDEVAARLAVSDV